MTFRKRFALLLIVVVAVPIATLLGLLAFVSSDSKRGKVDAALDTGVRASLVTYGQRADAAKRVAERELDSGGLGVAIESGDRAAIRRAADALVSSGAAVSVRVADGDGEQLASAGPSGGVAFGRASSGVGDAAVSISQITAAELVAELRRLTGLGTSIVSEGTVIAGRPFDASAAERLSRREPIDVDGQKAHGQPVELDREQDLTLVVLTPADARVLTLSRPAAVLLAVLALVLLSVAVGLARELGGLHARVLMQAASDPLTGLWNRRHLRRMLAREAERAERYGHHLSLLIMDIDGFKAINDRFGHVDGDAALQALAEAIRTQTRAMDEGARYGGDEMALVLPETGRAGAQMLAERLRAHAREVLSGEAGHDATVSIGVSTMPECAASVADLVATADHALLQAKRNGRDRVSVAPLVNPPLREAPAIGRQRGDEAAASRSSGRYGRKRGE